MKKDIKKETIKKLEELKNNLGGNTYEDNYCDLVNCAIDYDNNAEDDLYLHDTINEIVEFATDEEVEEIIKQELQYGVDRIRCFINDTRSSEIYKINAYGNLENVTDDDFIYVIDELIERLKG